MTYNADIAHCEGKECAIRDRCRRYQLHLMREKMKVIEDYLTSYTMPQYENGECEIFYPIGK